MWIDAFYGIIVPFVGTTIGSACVFFLRNTMSKRTDRITTRFAGIFEKG